MGWETVEDIAKEAEVCLSASVSGRNRELLLNPSDMQAVRAALASLPECLCHALSDIPELRAFRHKLEGQTQGSLTQGDLAILTKLRNLTRDLQIGVHVQQPGDDRMLLAQRARFAQWIHAAHTWGQAVNREGIAAAIFAARDRVDSNQRFLMPIDVPFSVIENAELPPPDLIGWPCYLAGEALQLSRMYLHRIPDPARFKESAEKLGIAHLNCSAPKGKLMDATRLSSLATINLFRANAADLDVTDLLAQMRKMPALRLVLLPRGTVLPHVPKGWAWDPHLSALRKKS